MPWPGFEPGLLRPQRRVLTTRRSRQLLLQPLPCLDIHFSWLQVDPDLPSWRHTLRLPLPLPPPARVRIGWVRWCQRVSTANEFSWCSGYHICLTHRRSPVRSRAKTVFETLLGYNPIQVDNWYQVQSLSKISLLQKFLVKNFSPLEIPCQKFFSSKNLTFI